MSILDVLFTVFIRPLELMFELIFAVANKIDPNPAMNLIVMSLAINFIVLPLYRRADVIQQEARDTENRLRPVMDHIKKSFKGDERVMMLQTFYRQQNYSPLSSMKSIISLVLQIPFFIAAYQFLSHLPLLEGQTLGPIKDLLAPDGLLTAGGVTINVLPILMTVINIISSEIYMKGQPFKSKIILYLSALIFLVLLYTSPAGLVFYWTFNNVFSLVKNIFYRLKNPGFIFKILCALTGIAGMVWAFMKKSSITGRQFWFLIVFFGALMIPLALHFIFRNRKKKEIRPLNVHEKLVFVLGVLFLAVFSGLYIPSVVVESCPEDFVYISELSNPAHYVWYSFFVACGVSVVWMSVYYLLADVRGKRIFALATFIMSVGAVINHFAFGMNDSTLSAEMEFENDPKFKAKAMIINGLVLLCAAAICWVIFRFKPVIAKYLLVTGLVVGVAIGGYNIYSTTREYNDIKSKCVFDEPVITLSKNGKNVIVFMLDRAIGGLVPYLFNEKQELYDMYDGFTYYPNTISYGIRTLNGSAPLFGGYEYTPEKMNERSDMLLIDKQNEALTVMPRIFSEAGFYTTVIDPPYGNYTYFDISFYDKYKDIHAYKAEQLMNPYSHELNEQSDVTRKHHIPLYCLFRVMPTVIQPSIYDDCNYLSLAVDYADYDDSVPKIPQIRDGVSKGTGQKMAYLNYACVLENLINMTVITEEQDNCFLMMESCATHEPMILKEPEYIPVNKVDNSMYDVSHMTRTMVNGRKINLDVPNQMAHYHVNMASLLNLGRWFDYLKKNGLWDNTKIIIVADHGRNAGHFNELINDKFKLDAEYFNPLLLVKDFGSTGFKTDNEFMTHADVPAIALSGIIDNPVNPFTGNPINSDAKYEGPQHVFSTNKWRPDKTAYTFPKGKWYSIHDDIYVKSNWEYLGEY